jgi:hypothetical protein
MFSISAISAGEMPISKACSAACKVAGFAGDVVHHSSWFAAPAQCLPDLQAICPWLVQLLHGTAVLSWHSLLLLPLLLLLLLLLSDGQHEVTPQPNISDGY